MVVDIIGNECMDTLNYFLIFKIAFRKTLLKIREIRENFFE